MIRRLRCIIYSIVYIFQLFWSFSLSFFWGGKCQHWTKRSSNYRQNKLLQKESAGRLKRMDLGSSSDVCWHSSRELYRCHCCHWGCWEPASLCLGFSFALLPPSASFPRQGTTLHILPISLSSTLLNHIGSVRHQFVVDPITHPPIILWWASP